MVLLGVLGVLFVLGRLGRRLDPADVQAFFQSPLFMIMLLTPFGIGALVFLYYEGRQVWHWWFPDQPLGPTVKRYVLRYPLQASTAALAYVQVRIYINTLTGVDAGNFPAALAALTVLATILTWLLVFGVIMLVTGVVYAGVDVVAGVRGKLDHVKRRGLFVAGDRVWLRAFGAVSVGFIFMAAYGLPADNPSIQRAIRTVVTYVLVGTQFSYDQTCAVSSKDRWVARLQDRKEKAASMVSIVEEDPSGDVRFSRGTCAGPLQP
jgi:hypothetical protein